MAGPCPPEARAPIGPSRVRCNCSAFAPRVKTRDGRRPPMASKLVFLPPIGDRTRQMAAALEKAVPEVKTALPADEAAAKREIADADAAFGTISPEVLREAKKLRWLQAPAAAPAAGYYHKELIEHPV